MPSWLRTRPTCGCSRPCVLAGFGVARRHPYRSGGNAQCVLFGAINIETGGRVFLTHGRQRGVEFEDFLEEVRWYYRGRHVALLLDEDSSHTAEDSQDEADELGIELLWLPKRSPHLNPMDHLWRHGKEGMSANHQYPSIDGQWSSSLIISATGSPTKP